MFIPTLITSTLLLAATATHVDKQHPLTFDDHKNRKQDLISAYLSSLAHYQCIN